MEHAEFKVLAEGGAVAPKPANLSFEQAAAMGFGGGSALHFLKKANIQAGEHLLINGASGSVGSAMIQLAKYFGAEVTAVCSSANTELVRSLGADHVIDYQETDFTSGREQYDLIADTVGNAPYGRVQAALKPGGRHLVIVGGFTALMGLTGPSWGADAAPLPAGSESRRGPSPNPLRAAAWGPNPTWFLPRADKAHSHQIVAGVAAESAEALQELTRIAETGAYAPVLHQLFPLAQIVDAHRLVETGHKRGNVVVTLPAWEPRTSS